MFHYLLLQLLLLSAQVVHLVRVELLLEVVVLLVFQRMRQQRVILGEELRHVIHQRPPVRIQRVVHLEQHLKIQISKNLPEIVSHVFYVALLLQFRIFQVKSRDEIRRRVELSLHLGVTQTQSSRLGPHVLQFFLHVPVLDFKTFARREQIAEVVLRNREFASKIHNYFIKPYFQLGVFRSKHCQVLRSVLQRLFLALQGSDLLFLRRVCFFQSAHFRTHISVEFLQRLLFGLELLVFAGQLLVQGPQSDLVQEQCVVLSVLNFLLF
jgi:hypothetical protein